MKKLRVAYMSSYDECCGIAAYTDRLITNIRHAVDVTLLKNRPFRKVACRHYDGINECECWDVTIWTNTVRFDAAAALAAVQDVDVLHVQFESALYYQEWMLPFLDAVRAMGIPVVVTAHSSCIWPTLYKHVTKWIAHSEQLAQCINGKWIHMPIVFQKFDPPVTTKRIVSFGLGRNNDGLVEQALRLLHTDMPGLAFEPHYATKQWVPEQELIDYLETGSAITLLYPPTSALVNSSAATFALGISRPLIITGTSWFSTVTSLFNGAQGVHVANCAETLAEAIRKCVRKTEADLFKDFENRKAVAVANNMTMEQVVEQHLALYQEIVK